MKKLTFIVMGAFIVAGCGQDKPSSTSAPKAEIAYEAPKIDHYYSMKEGFEYGYEQAVSQDAQNAGQIASTLMMFKYSGVKDGIYQAYSKNPQGAVTVAQCSNPCDFIKVMVFLEGEHISTERLKATEGTIGWLVMSDAINGKLEQYVGQQNQKKVHVWFNEQNGLVATPI